MQWLIDSVGTTYNEEGLRRGTRKRFKPLEYWRGEKLIIGRSANAPAPCPIVKALYQLPPETHEPLGVAGRKRKRQARSQSASRPPPSKRLNEDTNDLVPPEEGWDAETPLYAPTIDYDTGEEVVRRNGTFLARDSILTSFLRCGMYGSEYESSGDAFWSIRIPENLYGWRLHCFWNHDPSCRWEEASEEYPRQHLRMLWIFPDGC